MLRIGMYPSLILDLQVRGRDLAVIIASYRCIRPMPKLDPSVDEL